MSIKHQIFEPLVYGNIWIALSVSSYSFLAANWLGEELGLYHLILIFCATLLMYNFQRLFKLFKGIQHPRIQWMEKNIFLVYGLISLGILFCAISAFNIFDFSQAFYIDFAVLAVVGSVSLLYAFPFIGKKTSLRDIPFLKIHLIAISWALVSSVFILDITNNSLLLLLEKYLFVLAITIPFDIRDISIDEPEKKTIPQLLGIKYAKVLSAFLLICSWFLCHLNSFPNYSVDLLYLVAILLCSLAHPNKSDYFFSFLIDGIPIFALGFYFIFDV